MFGNRIKKVTVLSNGCANVCQSGAALRPNQHVNVKTEAGLGFCHTEIPQDVAEEGGPAATLKFLIVADKNINEMIDDSIPRSRCGCWIIIDGLASLGKGRQDSGGLACKLPRLCRSLK